MKNRHLFVSFTLGLGLAMALVWVLGGRSAPAVLALSSSTSLTVNSAEGAAPVLSQVEGPCAEHLEAPAAELHVCPAGPPTCDYVSVQTAVDAANDGDVIKVAAGVYTGVNARAGVTQVVYISKTVTIQGGYTTTNWTTPDPDANLTTLDAQGQGRVLYITSDPSAGSGQAISPTVEGLRITGGDATGLSGAPPSWGDDAGGGVYVYSATVTINNCVVISNTASTVVNGCGGGLYLQYSDNATLNGNTVQDNTSSTAGPGFGGGLYLYESDATLSGNAVQGNTASTAADNWGFGGGLYLYESDATLSGNTVQGNTASTADVGRGGGLYLYESDATLSGNTVQGNTASTANMGRGGGVHLWYSDATLSGNTVQGNTASTADTGRGGGVTLGHSAAVLSGNTVVSNTATLNPFAVGQGGGIQVWRSGAFTLTNNLVADNQANTEGSGLWFEGLSTDPISGCLLHTTIADNLGSGQGVYVGGYTVLTFTNTIIAGHHSVGITVTTGSTVTLEATLWHDNGADTGGGGTVTSNTDVYGDPAFVNPSAWNYHLTAGSAAIDKGVYAGVNVDIDGDPRPTGVGYDIGADEFWHRTYLPLVLRQYP